MRVKGHIEAFHEHREAIDWAINRGILDSQRIIGTHVSRGLIELLSAYLHKIHKIDSGFQINHRWFKSERVAERFPDFPHKKEIIEKMVQLEYQAELLTYGSQRSEKEIKDVLIIFNELEATLKELMKDER